MSLLLEALKKAERAKEEAQRRALGDNADATVAVAPPPAAPPPPEPPPAGPRTREDLPDIRQPLEILNDAPADPASAAAPTLALAEDAPKAPPQAAPQPRAAPKGDPQAGERAAARKVFEAKFKEPNPRLPFFITVGALGVFAIGTVVYFWIQLRPPAPLVNANPKPPAGEAQVAAQEPRRPAPSAPAAPKSGIPGLPGLTAPAPAAPSPAVPSQAAPAPARPVAPLAERAPETPLLKPRPAPAPRAAGPAETEISARRPAAQVHPKVGSAYAAYQAGDLNTARADYQEALREESSNRDALLGLAALDVRAGRLEAAEGGYLRLLQADPRDAHAQAALLALRAGRVDPVAAESRVKSMLADNPGAHVLNFTLGNQFAQQGRWAEAQAEYFRALAAEPDNADFAYNLAVSLDHLRQPKLALEYYQRAIALAKSRGASFDLGAAQTRAAQLGR
jgi:Tfp pilus assembly protein PilF